MQELTIILRQWTEKCRETGEANSLSLKVLLALTRNVHLCIWSFKKSLKMVVTEIILTSAVNLSILRAD